MFHLRAVCMKLLYNETGSRGTSPKYETCCRCVDWICHAKEYRRVTRKFSEMKFFHRLYLSSLVNFFWCSAIEGPNWSCFDTLLYWWIRSRTELGLFWQFVSSWVFIKFVACGMEMVYAFMVDVVFDCYSFWWMSD